MKIAPDSLWKVYNLKCLFYHYPLPTFGKEWDDNCAAMLFWCANNYDYILMKLGIELNWIAANKQTNKITVSYCFALNNKCIPYLKVKTCAECTDVWVLPYSQ